MRRGVLVGAAVLTTTAGTTSGLNMFGAGVGFGAKNRVFDVSPLDPPAVASWDTLREATPAHLMLDAETLQTGPPHAKAILRTHSRKTDETAAAPGDVKLTLYRDSAAWCPYCQKCWALLEEKKIPYKIEKINMACYGDKPRAFFEVQPSGTLPAAIIHDDDRVLRSSDAIIAAALDLPRGENGADGLDARDDARTRQLLTLERAHFSAWLRWLTGGPAGKAQFVSVLDDVEAALDEDRSGPFFLGRRFSFVDLMFAPFLERMAASLAYYKGYVVRETPYLRDSYNHGSSQQAEDDHFAFLRFPRLNAWFDAIEKREAYRATKADYYTHAKDLPPQLGGCVADRGASAEAVRRDVDVESWNAPGATPKFEPDWTWVADPHAEAAARLADNGPNVAKFAARATGVPGFPPARADLADPRALPDETLEPVLDALLRLIVTRLRNHRSASHSNQGAAASSDEEKESLDRLALAWLPEETKARARAAKLAIQGLEYLRDRVGVPRDMSFPAARALRQECNALIALLLASDDANKGK